MAEPLSCKSTASCAVLHLNGLTEALFFQTISKMLQAGVLGPGNFLTAPGLTWMMDVIPEGKRMGRFLQ